MPLFQQIIDGYTHRIDYIHHKRVAVRSHGAEQHNRYISLPRYHVKVEPAMERTDHKYPVHAAVPDHLRQSAGFLVVQLCYQSVIGPRKLLDYTVNNILRIYAGFAVKFVIPPAGVGRKDQRTEYIGPFSNKVARIEVRNVMQLLDSLHYTFARLLFYSAFPAKNSRDCGF